MAKTKVDANGRVCTQCNEYKLWKYFNTKRAHCKECGKKYKTGNPIRIEAGCNYKSKRAKRYFKEQWSNI